MACTSYRMHTCDLFCFFDSLHKGWTHCALEVSCAFGGRVYSHVSSAGRISSVVGVGRRITTSLFSRRSKT